MSLTFHAEMQPADAAGFRLEVIGALCDDLSGRHVFAAERDAQAARDAAAPPCASDECRDCWERGSYVVPVYPADAAAVSVHNGNAPRLLHLLGLPVDPHGEHGGQTTAEDLYGRALIALAVPDPAPSDGWAELRLGEIARLARWAREHRRPVHWG